jgi:hypothetical protein
MYRERIIVTILAAALLVWPIYHLRDEMETEEIRKNRYWVAKAHSDRHYPVLFGGDSRAFRGLSPDDFEREMYGIEAYNYAFWSNGMGRVYLEGLEKKLEMDSDLKMIVLGITPHSLTPEAAKCAHYLWETGRSKEQVLQHLYLSRVQEIFAPYSAVALYRKITGKTKPSNYRIIYHPNGWVESWWVIPDTAYAAQFYEEIFTDNRVSEEVIEGFLAFVERWTAMGIHVVGFRPPTSERLRQIEDRKGGFREEEFVARFTAAGGIWIALDDRDYQTFDGSHLDHNSARRLSADLARRIREQIPGNS